MMRNQDIVKLDQKNKMKAVAEKWKNISKTEKRKYEAKKDRLWKKHEKDVEKYKKVIVDGVFDSQMTRSIPRLRVACPVSYVSMAGFQPEKKFIFGRVGEGEDLFETIET